MPGSADLIDVVESAYRLDLDDHAWLHGVTRAAEACLEMGVGLMGYTFDLGRWPAIDFDSVVTVNFPPKTAEAAVPMLRQAPPASARAIMQMNCSTISQHLGDPATTPPEAYSFYRETYYPRDAFGVVATGPEQYGVVLSTLLPETTSLTPHVVTRWERLAAHIAAGMRLRRTLAPPRDGPAASPGEAVLEPAGRVCHAEGAARSRGRLEALRQAAVTIDRVRARLRRDDANQALALWRGLTAGRWSLVDRFESDGRRFYVAHANEPSAPSPRALSLRERQVAACAALGHSDKLIAYELGLALGTVAAYLRSARRKLGASSRTELIRVVSDLGGGATREPASDHGDKPTEE